MSKLQCHRDIAPTALFHPITTARVTPRLHSPVVTPRSQVSPEYYHPHSRLYVDFALDGSSLRFPYSSQDAQQDLACVCRRDFLTLLIH